MRRFFLLSVIVLFAASLRLYGIQAQSIWFDEGWSAYAAVQPGLGAAAAADATNPPLYYMLLHLAVRGFGDSPFALRFTSLLFDLVTIALTYQLGRRVFGERAGIFAAFLAACSPLLWWASQEARMYTLLALLVTTAALAWHTLLQSENSARARRALPAWLALWAAELALLYAHNTGPVVALWLNLVTLASWLIYRRLSRPDWRLWFAGQAIVGLLWSPYFVNRFLLLPSANSAVTHAPVIDLELLRRVWSAFWLGNWTLVTNSDSSLLVVAVGVLFLTLVLIPWRTAGARWMTTHVVILTAGLLLGLMVLGNELHGRYLVMITPLLLVPIGAGLARLQPPMLRTATAAGFALLLMSVINTVQHPRYGHDDVRGMVQYYADTLGEDDSVLAWSYADRYELAYYWPRFRVEAQRITLPEGGDLESVLPLLPHSGDVALNIWYTQRADFRGMMACLLGHGTVNVPEQFTTYGMSTLLYRNPSLNLPALHPLHAEISTARIDSAGEIPAFTADQALCVPIQIRLTAPTGADLKAALIVRNGLGWEIARTDAVFAQADQRTTSQLSPGEMLTAYPLVRLPYGAPPDRYQVYLRIYDEGAQVSGYEISVDGALVAGRELPLGVWVAPPGADWAQVNRETELAQRVDMPADNALVLAAMNPLPARAANGERLELSLLWRGHGQLPALSLTDSQNRWSVEIAPTTQGINGVGLDWREVVIPADAPSGRADLTLPDHSVIASLEIASTPALFEPPPFETGVGAELPGVGRLTGYTLAEATAAIGEPLPITLVWQAGDTPIETSYTVFAQLLDADGRVIAQSDAIPANFSRPTTGWRDGEYIIDEHMLRFNENAAPGDATLIVGMYEGTTFQRVLFADGTDSVMLPVRVAVK